MKINLTRFIYWLGFLQFWILNPVWGQSCPGRLPIRLYVQQSIGLGSPEERLSALQKLERTCVTCGYADDSVYVKILRNIGSTYLFLGQDSAAYITIRKALALNLTNRPQLNPGEQANLYYYIGLIEKRFKNYPAALIAFDKATRIGRTYNRLQEIWPFAYRIQIVIYYDQGDYERALDKAIQSELVNREARKPQYVAQSLAYQGLIYFDYQQFSVAEKRLAEAVSILRKVAVTDPGKTSIQYDLASYLTWLANAQRLTNHDQQSLENYQRARTIFSHDKERDNDAVAEAEASIGQVLAENLRESNRAMPYFAQALQRTTDTYLKARILDYRGQAYQLQGHYAVALQQYQEALNGFSFGPHSTDVVANPSPQAIRLAAKKEYVFSVIQHKADAWLAWATQTNNRSYLRQALTTYRLADQMIDFMRWEYAGQHSKLYWRQKTRNLYERAIQTCHQLGDAEQAYYFFEKSRAVLLTDKLNELGARRLLSARQTTQEDHLRQRITDQQNQLAQAKPGTSDYATIQNGLVVQEERLDSLVKALETSNPTYYRYKYANTVLPIAEVQAWLRKNHTTLVTYFISDSALYILNVSPSRMQFLRQSTGAYASLAGQYMALLSTVGAINTHFSQFLATSNALYNQVLAPLKLPPGRVVVSPDGFFIPFDALSSSATQPAYLLADYAFSYTYSAQILLKNDPVLSTGDQLFLGMAPVNFSNQLPLAGSDQVLRDVGGRFTHSTLLTGLSATRRAFRSIAPTATVVQLFTHADADSLNREPILYFADSTLKLSEIVSDQAFQTKLLVLTACKTGIGQNQKGEGIFSLARGFAALNVPSVVTTLWSVENQPTYRLTDLFYQQLLTGLPKDLALQRAKQEFYREASPTDQLPSQWAGLILIGQADPLSPQSPDWALRLWVAGAILLTITMGWVVQRRISRTGQHDR